MFGVIPKIKIWQRKGTLAILDSRECEGSGSLGITSLTNGYILSMNNSNRLLRRGYLRKFISCTREAVEHGDFSPRSSAYAPNYLLELNFDEEKHGTIVRMILDDKKLSKLVKFAAISSILAIQPGISDDRLMSIIRSQTPVEEIPDMPFWRNLWFILPDFATTEGNCDRVKDARIWSSSGLFDIFLNRAGFICHSYEDETYGEYLERTGDNYFKPASSANESDLTDLYVMTIPKTKEHELKIDQTIKSMCVDEAKSFLLHCVNTPPEFWSFVIEQLKTTGIRPYVKTQPLIYQYLPPPPYLYSVRDELVASGGEELLMRWKSLGYYGAPLAAQFYYKGGVQAVIDLISHIEKASVNQVARFTGRNILYSGSTVLMVEGRIKSLQRALSEEYEGIPLSWALQICAPFETYENTPEEDED